MPTGTVGTGLGSMADGSSINNWACVTCVISFVVGGGGTALLDG